MRAELKTLALRHALHGLVVGTLLLLALCGAVPGVAQAQGEFPTDADCEILAEPIPGRHLPATAIEDSTGNIHLFWQGIFFDGPFAISPGVEEPSGDINYRTWNGSAWSPTYNIIHSSDSIQYFSVTIDGDDVIHLLWEDGGIRYSRAAASEAHIARIWMRNARQFLEPLAAGPAIVAGKTGFLYVIAPTREGTLTLLHSHDAGTSWSNPTYMAEPQTAPGTTQRAQYVSISSVTVDEYGTLHAVWSSHPETGYPMLGLFYIRSSDEGVTWSEPVVLAPARHGQARLRMLNSSDLVVVWDGDAATAGRYARRSTDGGVTWSEMETILPPSYPGGLTGSPGVAVDSAGRAHVLMGSDDWAYYTSLDAARWSGPRRMPICQAFWMDKEALKTQIPIGGSALEVGSANLLTTEGNHLHAIWESLMLGIVYVSWRVDSPLVPVPTASPARAVTPTKSPPTPESSMAAPEIAAAVPTAVVAPAKISPADTDNVVPTLWQPILAGVLPVVILIGVMVVVSRRGGARH